MSKQRSQTVVNLNPIKRDYLYMIHHLSHDTLGCGAVIIRQYSLRNPVGAQFLAQQAKVIACRYQPGGGRL
jgi:hypothetical protein